MYKFIKTLEELKTLTDVPTIIKRAESYPQEVIIGWIFITGHVSTDQVLIVLRHDTGSEIAVVCLNQHFPAVTLSLAAIDKLLDKPKGTIYYIDSSNIVLKITQGTRQARVFTTISNLNKTNALVEAGRYHDAKRLNFAIDYINDTSNKVVTRVAQKTYRQNGVLILPTLHDADKTAKVTGVLRKNYLQEVLTIAMS